MPIQFLLVGMDILLYFTDGLSILLNQWNGIQVEWNRELDSWKRQVGSSCNTTKLVGVHGFLMHRAVFNGRICLELKPLILSGGEKTYLRAEFVDGFLFLSCRSSSLYCSTTRPRETESRTVSTCDPEIDRREYGHRSGLYQQFHILRHVVLSTNATLSR